MRSLLVFLHLVILIRVSDGAPLPAHTDVETLTTDINYLTCTILGIQVGDPVAALDKLQLDGITPVGLEGLPRKELAALLQSCLSGGNSRLASPEASPATGAGGGGAAARFGGGRGGSTGGGRSSGAVDGGADGAGNDGPSGHATAQAYSQSAGGAPSSSADTGVTPSASSDGTSSSPADGGTTRTPSTPSDGTSSSSIPDGTAPSAPSDGAPSSSPAALDTPSTGYPSSKFAPTNLDAGSTGSSSPNDPSSATTGDSSTGAAYGSSVYPSGTFKSGNNNVASGYPSDPAVSTASSVAGYPGDLPPGGPAIASGDSSTSMPSANTGYTSYGDGNNESDLYSGRTGHRAGAPSTSGAGANDVGNIQRVASSGSDQNCGYPDVVCTDAVAENQQGPAQTDSVVGEKSLDILLGGTVIPNVVEGQSGCPSGEVSACANAGDTT